MTDEQKKRYEELDKIVCDSVREMWSIMAPTEEEINDVAEQIVCNDTNEVMENVTDHTAPLGMLYMLTDIEFYREFKEDDNG